MSTAAERSSADLALARVMAELAERGLNIGSAGNASLRVGEALCITPTGYAGGNIAMSRISLDGTPLGGPVPSSEWRMHADILHARPDAGAVIHTHAPAAVALACQRREIPPFHYMIARFGGNTVRCAEYATFGTRALSDAALTALSDRCACLLANHGMVVVGCDLEHALKLAIELETLCEQYWRTCQLGPPVLLSATEMAEVHQRFASYGQPRPSPPEP